MQDLYGLFKMNGNSGYDVYGRYMGVGQYQEYVIPLRNVDVQVSIVSWTAQVVVTQSFFNEEDKPIEATYFFPLPASAAVCGFEALIDNKRVVGKVKEKFKAQAIYDDAISSGKGAYLLEALRPDYYKLSVGNLPGKKSVDIKVTYVQELNCKNFGKTIEFFLPATIGQRYISPNSPKDDFENAPQSHSVPYRMGITINMEMAFPISRVTCISNHVLKSDIQKTNAVSTLEEKAIMNRDFRIEIELKSRNEPNVVCEVEDKKDVAALLTFFPSFEFKSIGTEIIILLDRSGSMSGQRIQSASQALIKLIKKMPNDILVNIVGFGSSYTSLFPKSQPVGTERSAFVKHLEGVGADLGGTEIYQPLKFIFDNYSGRARQVLLVTDGEVSDTNSIINLVSLNCNTTRVFAFGIGEGVSTALIEGVAKAGLGASEHIKSGDIDEAVSRQLGRLLQGALRDVSLEWDTKEKVILQAPTKLPPIWNEDKYTVVAILPPSVRTTKVTLSGIDGENKRVSWTLDVDASKAKNDLMIHRLAGKKLIDELETGELSRILSINEARKRIIEIAIRFSLASQFTSYIAVEEREEPTLETMQKRDVPVLPPVDQVNYDSTGGGWLFVEKYDPTIEDSYRKLIEVDGEQYMLEILDCAGTEQFSAMRDLYMKNGHVFVLVWSLIAASTFNEIPDYFDQLCRVRDQELKDIPIMLVGNKADLGTQRVVDQKQGIILSKYVNKTFVETSAKTGMNGGFVFRELIREYNLKHPRDPKDKSYREIKVVVMGSGGVGKSSLTVGFVQGGEGSLVQHAIFPRDKSKDQIANSTQNQTGVQKFFNLFKKSGDSFTIHFKKITKKFTFNPSTYSEINWNQLLNLVVKQDPKNGAYWDFSPEFFAALGSKKKISATSDHILSTLFVVILLEILLADRSEKLTFFTKQELDNWKATGKMAYAFLFQSFQLDPQNPDEPEEQSRKLKEQLYNTCILLCNEFKLCK